MTEVESWLRSHHDLDRVAASFQARIVEDGLYVLRDGARVPIPPLLTPVVRDEAFERFSTDAAGILAAAEALATEPTGTDLERSAFVPGRELVTARVDGLATDTGVRAIELNTTIPAMQGYGDIVTHGWVRTIGEARGRSPDRIADLVRRCGSHASELLASLVAAYHRHHAAPDVPSVLIVARAGDSQTGELHYLRRAWTDAGHRVALAVVDRVDVRDGVPWYEGERFDVVYRHIFARRVDPSLPFARLLLDPGGRMFNPVAAPLESKALFARLRHPAVPWTAELAARATTPEGDDLVRWTLEHRERAVLKRAEGYGGVGVFLGVETPDWAERVRAAVAEGGFVVQEHVAQRPEPHLVARDGRVVEMSLYLDRSAFTSSRAPRPTGGVVRAAPSRIVNILGGGGLAAFVPPDVLAEL